MTFPETLKLYYSTRYLLVILSGYTYFCCLELWYMSYLRFNILKHTIRYICIIINFTDLLHFFGLGVTVRLSYCTRFDQRSLQRMSHAEQEIFNFRETWSRLVVVSKIRVLPLLFLVLFCPVTLSFDFVILFFTSFFRNWGYFPIN